MGNKLANTLKVHLKGKEISTETLKEIYIQFSEEKNVDSVINMKNALKFVKNLFKIYDLPKQNDQQVTN